MTRTRRSSHLTLLALLAALGVVPSACAAAKQQPKQADTPTGLEGDSSGESAVGTPPAATADAPEPVTPLGQLLNGNNATAGSDQQKLFDQVTAAPAAKTDPKGATAADGNAKKIRDLAKQFAPNMTADGPMFRATLKENERVQADVTLKTGTCYAIVGVGDKVKDLDLRIMLAPGVMTAQDTTDDMSPVIGRAPDPFCPSSELTYKLDIFAEKGGGDVAVQVYSRPR
jgi:hypothetical protein